MGYVTIVGAIALLVVMQYTSVSACYYPTQYQSNSGEYMILLYIVVVLCVVIGQLHADKCDYHAKIN